ncbi:hypothetical protein A9Q97_03450 [Rhodospirillales bacterium 47_12_T64]|nr:hypothetical protein A9Q97_03450 [Rhodospirillales bacterium 47_12_T64]
MKFLPSLPDIKPLACSLIFLASLSTNAFSQQTPQRTVTRHGNWASHCSVNAPASCYIVHNVTLGDNPKPVLIMAIGRPVNTSTDITTLILTLPLGVRLPEGFSLEVGPSLRRKQHFERCIVSGCQAEIPVDNQLLQQFKSQNEGRVVFFDAVKKPIAIPFSLKGFTKAFGQVTAP